MEKLYDRPEVCRTYFFPQPRRPLPEGDRAGPLALALDDGTRLSAFWSRPLDGAPTILYLHGNGESIADQLGHWPSWAAAAGANICFVDYPGYGASEGGPTFSSCCAAARAALARLLARPPAEVPQVLLAGRSVGSIFALDAAAGAGTPRLAGLLLESGVADLGPRLDMRLAYDQLGLDRAALHAQLERDFDHRRKVRSLGCPLLILHTRHDSLVPAWNSERLAAWAGARLQRLVLFDAGDHNDIQWVNGAEYQRLLRGFVKACAGGAGC